MEIPKPKDAYVIDFKNGCYIVKTCEYINTVYYMHNILIIKILDNEYFKLPPNSGEYLEFENNEIIEIEDNNFLRLKIPDDTEEDTNQEQLYVNHQNVHNDPLLNQEDTINNTCCWKSARHQTDNDVNATVTFLEANRQ
ncbi:hypothetical protein QE152_g25157 [Popillia japonica]|uniref:Uncharacterized protein n=1 Tax=Popillia japonica TaxID=7064 RepID=A0AAW1K231_POPJA